MRRGYEERRSTTLPLQILRYKMEESTFVEKYHNVCGHLTLEKLKDFLTDVARASGKEQLYSKTAFVRFKLIRF